LQGVTMEEDVVVAAGSVVTSHLAARAIYAGAPAKRIRDLESPGTYRRNSQCLETQAREPGDPNRSKRMT
jgi:serine acetyltransferase